jgi:hypothetical protein
MKIYVVLNVSTLEVGVYRTAVECAGHVGVTIKTIRRGIDSGRTIKGLWRVYLRGVGTMVSKRRIRGFR